jgi:hypothetical protein
VAQKFHSYLSNVNLVDGEGRSGGEEGGENSELHLDNIEIG